MAIVYGFGGFRLKESGAWFAPALPKQWDGYRFKLIYLGSHIQVEVKKDGTTFTLESGEPVQIHVYGDEYLLTDSLKVSLK